MLTIALVSSAVAGWYAAIKIFPVRGPTDPVAWFLIVLWSWNVVDSVILLRTLRKENGELEYVFPRRWGREWELVGRVLVLLSAVVVLTSAYAAAAADFGWIVFVLLGLTVGSKGFLALRYGGVVEFRKHGVLLAMRLTSWRDVGSFYAWAEDKDGRSVLQIRVGNREAELRCPRTEAVDAVLDRHGRAPR